ncbi:MAG: paraquat-inducible protein A [Rubrivivax sp.]
MIAYSTPVADCLHCGTLQRVPLVGSQGALDCAVCASPLQRTVARSNVAALAFASATLLLLIPANLLPFLTTSIVGVSRQSRLVDSATAMWGDGFPELGIAIGLFVVVLPLLRCALMCAVLGALRLDPRPAWLGRAFRHAQALQVWAMADVFLLGFAIAWARLETTISIDIGTGAWCFVAAAIGTLLMRATLDAEAVWHAIGTPDDVRQTDREARRHPPSRSNQPPLVCTACDLRAAADRAGSPCPRCGQRLHRRKPLSVATTAAFAVAAALLYVPSNLYPMATLPVGLQSEQYTVLEGVIDLWYVQLYGLAGLVFTASFAIPIAKLLVLAWCLQSVLRRSTRRLALKTRAHRVVEEIGRWSMVDPFVIACFVPVTQYNALLHGSAEAAAPMFTAVVILTTLAARCFDPRLMWDAANRQPDS